MKYILALVTTILFNIQLFATTDSLYRKDKEFSMFYFAFPKIESGIVIQYHFRKWAVNLGSFSTFQNWENNGNESQLPYNSTDTSMTFRYGIFSRERKNHFQFGIGYDYKVKFLNLGPQSEIHIRSGMNWAIGRFEINEYYGETKVDFFKDSSNNIYYHDQNGMLTSDVDKAQYTSLFMDNSTWKYNLNGFTVYLGIHVDLISHFSLGFTFFGNYRRYVMGYKTVQDRLGILSEKPIRYSLFEQMMYLTFGIHF